MKALAILAVAGALVLAGGVASEAKADVPSDAYLSCPSISGFKIELPAAGSERMSLFYFRVDGGPWYTTSWYYTYGLAYYEWRDSQWQAIGVGGGFLPVYGFKDDNLHTVEAWEWRAYSNSNGWHYLGTCQASSPNPDLGINLIP